ILVASTVTLYISLWIFQPRLLKEEMVAFLFCMLMFSLSIFLMVSRRDSLKILTGLNMAENSLYPLLAKTPITLIPFILVLMIFVTAVGTYIIVEAHRDYGTILVNRWRW
ncbi:MAG: NADH-quinone oxidoreductase subunit K, partial [Candidatus Bathyarchaeota archaeon]|nr:NADH-quinone oxidoreductase subunit K [Candidatus Bathyarchaeota archaeon]